MTLPVPTRVLLVDDDAALGEFLEQALRQQGLTAVAETSAVDALERLAVEDFEVVVTDLQMPGVDGLAFTQRVLERRADLPVIVLTGEATLDGAIAALRLGAWDFLTKPVEPARLAASVRRAAMHRALGREVQRLERLVPSPGVSALLGESVAMRHLRDLIARVAPGDAAVLISGESGTGKELVARALHLGSGRHAGPFVAINCGAVPPTLLESELFGHARGAFTDARQDRPGLFLEAHGGTLFLDEIAELPLDLQPKLLRALQERVVRPVGSSREVPFDARLVTATNRDLETEVHERRFREDLYYRVNVVHLTAPPLREREGDVLLLVRHFLARGATTGAHPGTRIAPAALARLLAYEWPGNVRELEHALESARAMATGEELGLETLPASVQDFRSGRVVVAADRAEELVTLDELEHRYLGRVLALLGGNKTRAAEVLGIDRRTLYRMLERTLPVKT